MGLIREVRPNLFLSNSKATGLQASIQKQSVYTTAVDKLTFSLNSQW